MKETSMFNLFLIFTTTFLSLTAHSISQESDEYFELTRPIVSKYKIPSCTLQVINYTFTNATFQTPYNPPSDCPPPWSLVVLELRAAGVGNAPNSDGSHCISGLWLGGSELLRTSSPHMDRANNSSRNLWKVEKDITRYSYLLQAKNLHVTMVLRNVVEDAVVVGNYNISVNFVFYKKSTSPAPEVPVPLNIASDEVGELNEVEAEVPVPLNIASDEVGELNEVEEGGNSKKTKGLYEKPADMVIPISSDGDGGFWFKIKNPMDRPSKKISIPRNTHRAVIELYVSFHDHDEFWYQNPPSSYLRYNNITSWQGNSNYREIFVTIDGGCVGFDLPFPLVMPGGINHLFWKPVVGIGAFDMPSYDFDVTPFLQKVLDGEAHEFGVGVENSIPYWLVDSNLHLWLDQNQSSVSAGTVVAHNPVVELQTKEEFKGLDGQFETKGKGKSESRGWVVSSAGNFTTLTWQRFKLESKMEFRNNGTSKTVELKIKLSRKVKVYDQTGKVISEVETKRKYPIYMNNFTMQGRIVTNFSHSFEEKYYNGNTSRFVNNKQEANGWLQIANGTQLGSASTRQNLNYNEGSKKYTKSVSVADGKLSGADLYNNGLSSSF